MRREPATAAPQPSRCGSQDASGLDDKVDLSAGESEDPSSWGGLVFGEKRKAFIQAEFTKAAGSAAGRLAIKKVRA